MQTKDNPEEHQEPTDEEFEDEESEDSDGYTDKPKRVRKPWVQRTHRMMDQANDLFRQRLDNKKLPQEVYQLPVHDLKPGMTVKLKKGTSFLLRGETFLVEDADDKMIQIENFWFAGCAFEEVK